MLRGGAPAAELHALGFEPQPLFERRLAAQPDRAAGAEHAVLGQAVAGAAQQLHDQAVVERIPGGGSHGGIGGHAPARDAADHVKDRFIAGGVRAPQLAAQRALQRWIQALHTPQQ